VIYSERERERARFNVDLLVGMVLQVRYVGLTSLYMAVMMSDGLDVVTVELELE